ERKKIRGAEKSDAATSYEALLAKIRETATRSVDDDLKRRLAVVPATLKELAQSLAQDEGTGATKGFGPDPLATLLARVDSVRRAAEDATADTLFEEACGFDPGRIGSASLERVFDVSWIARLLRWDDARRLQWTRSRRARFEQELATIQVPRILARVGLADP